MKNKVRIYLKSFDYKYIIISSNEIIKTVKKTGSIIKGPIPIPTKRNKFTILTSPHVNKDARDQYEIFTHKRIIDIYNITDKTIDSLMKLDINPGVYLKISLLY